MTTEPKTKSEREKESCFGFAFGGPRAMKEMMKMWSQPGMEFCKCCRIGDAKKASSERKKSAE